MQLKSISYWSCFYIVIAIASLIDYIEHVSRVDGNFSQDKLGWFLFSFACTLTLIVVVALTNQLTRRLFKTGNLILQSACILVALVIHTFLTGPFYNKLFFSQSLLYFHFNLVTVAIGLGIFYIIRFTYFVLRKS
jgi:hypothetical protein